MYKDDISKDRGCGCQTSKPACKNKLNSYCNVKPDMNSMFVYPINLCDMQIYQVLCQCMGKVVGLKLVDSDFSEPKAGGIKVTYTDENSYDELGTEKDSLSDIQTTGKGVSGTQTYYAYTMIDSDSEAVMGILFVRKGVEVSKLEI